MAFNAQDAETAAKVVMIGIMFAEKLLAMAKRHGTPEDVAGLELALATARTRNAAAIADLTDEMAVARERNVIEGGPGTND